MTDYYIVKSLPVERPIAIEASFRGGLVQRNIAITVEVDASSRPEELVPFIQPGGVQVWPDPMEPDAALRAFISSVEEGFFGRPEGSPAARADIQWQGPGRDLRAAVQLPPVRSSAVVSLARVLWCAGLQNGTSRIVLAEEAREDAPPVSTSGLVSLEQADPMRLPEVPFPCEVDPQGDDALVICVTFSDPLGPETSARMRRLTEAYERLVRIGGFARSSGEHMNRTSLELAGTALADEWVTRLEGFEPEPKLLEPFLEALAILHRDARIEEVWVR